MAIAVAYKWAPNPQDAEVSEDGTVDWSRARSAVSADDPVAIHVGRELASALGEELVALSVGNPSAAASMAKKAAMSRGFDRGIIAAGDDYSRMSLTQTGFALAALVKHAGNISLVCAGDSSIDENAKIVPSIMAGVLGWPCFQDVTHIDQTDGSWFLTQSTDRGSRVVRVEGPVVAMIAPDAAEPKVPGMKDIVAAGKKPVEVISLSELAVPDVSVSVSGRSTPPATTRKCALFEGPDAPQRIVEALASDSVL